MTLEQHLNELEHAYFFQREKGGASGSGYIGTNTFRAWRSTPYKKGVIGNRLESAFRPLNKRLDEFIRDRPQPSREEFDRFHSDEVDWFYGFTHLGDIVIHPSASGEYHGYPYNAYAKIVNLAHMHGCFHKSYDGVVKYDPLGHPHLRHCLHVVLDSKVNIGIRDAIKAGILPESGVEIPSSMGGIKTKQHYYEIQDYLRSVVDSVASRNFPGHSVCPLAFEGHW
jgi:hypothetical protein